VKREALEFTLLDGALGKLSKQARLVLQRGSIYDQPVEADGLAYMIGTEQDCMPEIGEELVELSSWGLISQPPGTTTYAIHSLVKDWARKQIPILEQHELLIMAANYWLGVGKESRSLNPELNAWQYLISAGEVDQSFQVMERIAKYLDRFGQVGLLLRMLKINTPGLKGRSLASALHIQGVVYQGFGEYPQALKYYEQSLAIDEELGDRSGVAYSLGQLGILHQIQGEYSQALKYYEQSMAIAEELGDRSGVGNSLHQLGMLRQDQGEYPQALKYYEQSLAIAEELGDRSGMSRSLHQLGNLHCAQGEYPQARHRYEQSLAIKKELGDRSGMAITLAQMGLLFEQEELLPNAVVCLVQAAVLFQSLGAPQQKQAQKDIARLKGKMGADTFQKALADAGMPLNAQEPDNPGEGITREQVIKIITNNTIVVLTNEPEKKEKWRQELGQLHGQLESQGISDLAVFADLCYRLIEGAKPQELTPQVPENLQTNWQTILSKI